jgi:hypothetical protein
MGSNYRPSLIRGGKEAAIIAVLAGGRYVGWSQVQQQLKRAVFFSDSFSMRLYEYIQIFFLLIPTEGSSLIACTE